MSDSLTIYMFKANALWDLCLKGCILLSKKESIMKKTLVYDLPTRIFHWLFVSLFVSSFLIAEFTDDESVLYPYHMILGLILASAVILRILWGIFGSTYARFTSFDLNPKNLITYLQNIPKKNKLNIVGHNPASSYAAILMMICSLGLAFTGYQMGIKNDKDFYEDIHELLANLFLALAIFHVIGIILHTVKYKDPIGLSMLNGKKSTDDKSPGITSTHPLVAFVFVLLIVGVGFNLLKNYNSNTGVLTLMGKTLTLGESDEKNGEEEEGYDDD
ncbi:MAG: DUF4405 domain-containing protein [Alphaproteobacteria bacterium]|nr:MAG: DUF4405 domain-containing protein [Alphaproteobacteria bacterium]